MAQHLVQLALQGAPPVIQNYETILEGAKQRVQKLSVPGRRNSRKDKDQGYQSDVEYNYYSGRRYMDRPRGRDQGGPRSAPYVSQDKYYQPRQSSVKDVPRAFPPPAAGYSPRDPYAPSRRDYRPKSAGRYHPASDSESSPPPRQRDRRRRNTVVGDAVVGGAAAGAGYGAAADYYNPNINNRMAPYARPQSQENDDGNNSGSKEKNKDGGKDKKQKDDSDSDSDSDSSSDSSSLGRSSEDEREHKHIRAKEFITAGLAAVATVHAASGVYNSMEARDKRMEKVKNGSLSPDEARKERTKALLQDFAAVGVAALSIKGAMAKWSGAKATHKHRKEHKQKKVERAEKRHEKRLEKASTFGSERSAQGGPPKQNARPGYNRSYSRSEPDLSRQYYNGTPARYVPAQYMDANPYAPYGRR